MAGDPEVVYGVLYPKGVLEKTQFLYVTPDIDEARNYSTVVYPGSIIVLLTVDNGE
jgi:hypothetical protein